VQQPPGGTSHFQHPSGARREKTRYEVADGSRSLPLEHGILAGAFGRLIARELLVIGIEPVLRGNMIGKSASAVVADDHVVSVE
jgi:hypothetical protein